MKKKEDQNLALYRKYRPKKFDEVLGQDHIVDILENSIKSNSPSHAYLFVGSRGTGKTSVARIFAQELGVSQNDLYEIDAASNRSIDDIRELRDGVRMLPFDSKYKVYIIDEVHMLTKEAFNALLKTLEEPPKHVIFVLATTELQKIPHTILSRCQLFTFKKPTDTILKNAILNIGKKEGFDLDNDSLELITILGDGSFRDAQGVLEKVLSFSKSKKISREFVEEITGAPTKKLIDDFIKSIAEKNIEEGMLVIHKASSQNLDMKLYLKLIIQKFRNLIVLKYAPKFEKEMLGDLREEDFLFLKDLIKGDNENILRSQTLAILLQSYQDIDRAFISELPLELALIKILGKN